MEPNLFEELLASVAETGEILRGEKAPARITKYESGTDDSSTPPEEPPSSKDS